MGKYKPLPDPSIIKVHGFPKGLKEGMYKTGHLKRSCDGDLRVWVADFATSYWIHRNRRWVLHRESEPAVIAHLLPKGEFFYENGRLMNTILNRFMAYHIIQIEMALGTISEKNELFHTVLDSASFW